MRARLVVASLLAAAVLAPVALAGSRGAAASERSAVAACRPWHVRTILTGQGWLESLAFDRRGRVLLSALLQNKILRLDRHGRLSTVLDE